MPTEIADAVLTLRLDDGPLAEGLAQAEARVRAALATMERALASGPAAAAGGLAAPTLPRATVDLLTRAAPASPLAATSVPALAAARSTAPRPPAAPLVGAINVTVDREHPRAVQAGIERALADFAARADLGAALD